MAALVSSLPELALKNGHRLRGSDHHHRNPYGIDQSDNEIEHLFRPTVLCKTQVLYFVYDQYPDLIQIDQLCQHQRLPLVTVMAYTLRVQGKNLFHGCSFLNAGHTNNSEPGSVWVESPYGTVATPP